MILLKKYLIDPAKKEVRFPFFLYCSFVLGVAGFAVSLLYYAGRLPNNFISGYCWPLSLLFLLFAFTNIRKLSPDTPAAASDRSGLRSITSPLLPALKSPGFRFFLLLSIVYFVSHLFRYTNAPWNNYGLFDDAAWDIYIAKERCFNGNTFEIIFWDDAIGRISRELFFHYYISILFRIFGYNMFVFNMALIFQGYITVIFTYLLASRIFQNRFSGFLAGLFLNFFPLHYTQVFMGHRYSICAPLVMVSLYFLYRAFEEKKLSCAVTGGVFAGFAMESAIMGKQYLWGLLGAALLSLPFCFKKKDFLKERIPVVLFALIGFAISAAPLYAYIFTHGELYRIREADLTRQFFEQLRSDGPQVLWDHINRIRETLFQDFSPARQFSMNFPITPWYILLPLIVGGLISLFKKQFILPLMVAIPAAGNIIADCFDFRLLLAAPFIAILLTAALHTCGRLLADRFSLPPLQPLFCSILLVAILFSPFRYLWTLCHDPHGQYFLNHTDLAVCRFIQDVVTGSEAPDFEMKADEFNRPQKETDYEVLAATRTSYAHIHAFLQPYDAGKILSLLGDFPYIGRNEEELRNDLYQALYAHPAGNKDLILLFEYDPQLDPLLGTLHSIGLFEEEVYQTTLEDQWICMLEFRVKSYDLPALRQKAFDYFFSP